MSLELGRFQSGVWTWSRTSLYGFAETRGGRRPCPAPGPIADGVLLVGMGGRAAEQLPPVWPAPAAAAAAAELIPGCSIDVSAAAEPLTEAGASSSDTSSGRMLCDQRTVRLGRDRSAARGSAATDTWSASTALRGGRDAPRSSSQVAGEESSGAGSGAALGSALGAERGMPTKPCRRSRSRAAARARRAAASAVPAPERP